MIWHYMMIGIGAFFVVFGFMLAVSVLCMMAAAIGKMCKVLGGDDDDTGGGGTV